MASGGIVAGASKAPTFAPELNKVVARARSLRGNHCATALIAAGKLPSLPEPERDTGDGEAADRGDQGMGRRRQAPGRYRHGVSDARPGVWLMNHPNAR